MTERTQWFRRLVAACVLVVGVAGVSSAQGPPRPRKAAPELNPATGATALALLSGGILVLRGLRRR